MPEPHDSRVGASQMPDDEVRAYGRYEVVRQDRGVLEFSALGPVESGSATGFSHHGVVGADLDVEDGRAAAERCGIALLTAAESHLGDLDRLVAVRRVRVFVAAVAGFAEHATIADAASEALIRRLGDRGAHARTVVGVASLPFDLPVVVEMTARTDRGDEGQE